MKILLHCNSPWDGSGYGQQAAVWLPRLATLGHEVAVSATSGLAGSVIDWHGHRIYPLGQDEYGADLLADHAEHFGADLVITLMDVFALDPEPWADRLMGRVACWMPVDCDDGGGLVERHIGHGDHLRLLQSAARPIAMSRFGETQLRKAGHDPLYVPHGIDCHLFRPPADKKALKAAAGLAGQFVIGMVSANADKVNNRKCWPEQLAAFAKLHARHPDTVLLAHTVSENSKRGIRLDKIARDLGLTGAVRWTDGYALKAGLVSGFEMAALYGQMDVYSGCSKAEGFGLPILEAQACGVPTIVTDGSAMSEVGCGWKVQGEPEWSRHAAYWRRPSVASIHRAYERAYEIWRKGGLETKGTAARQHALNWDADLVLTQHWKPVLAELERKLP